MRALLPPETGEVDVHDWYARDWVDGGGVRVNFIASVDGGITVDGASRGLQTPGDNRVFAALRDLADVVLVASGTAKAEGYQTVTLSDRRRQWRREHGFGEWLPTAVVTGRLDLDPTSGLFVGENHDRNRTMVVTHARSDAGRRAALAEVADVVVAGEDSVDLAAARAALEERGLTRVLCEGGPSLFAALARAGVADELDLSVSPLLVGPGSPRIVGGEAWDGPPLDLRLHALLEEDDALFARYRLGDPS
ncbi:dihydrofolate reductase family protein [Jatrophihabitans sp. YIM 134969]